MTVRIQDIKSFAVSKEQMKVCVLRALGEKRAKYSYVKINISEDGSEINVRIKPKLWPLILSTKSCIKLCGGDANCSVEISICSQWYILGDCFNYYTGYIKDLFDKLEGLAE
jgi:hypothetical protein